MLTRMKILGIAGLLIFFSGCLLAQDTEVKKQQEKKNEIPAQQPTLIKHIQRIVGTWELTAVYDGNKDITGNDTVGSEDQQIEFTRDAKYKRYTSGEEIDSGVFTMNENHSLVYLESKTGGETTSWVVDLNDQNNMMTMQSAQSTAAHGKRFKFTYRKKAEQN
jgi:hypothetical protein